MKKLIGVVVLAAMALFSLRMLTGCAAITRMLSNEEKLDYSAGAWNDNGVYESKCLNMQFAIPDGWKNLSEQEMERMINGGAESLSDKQKSQLNDMKKALNYEFVIQDEYETVQFAAEDLELSVNDINIKEEEYIKMLREQLPDSESYTYVFGVPYIRIVAGKQFTVLPISVNNDTMRQLHYLRNEEGYMLQIIATFYPHSEDTVTSIIQNNFKKLQE